MTHTTLKLLLLTLILILAQVVVFNHVCLFNVAVPIVFIYALIKLPLTLNVNWVLTVGFIMGLVVDIFSDTYGMNALSCTILAMARRPVIQLYMPRGDEPSDSEPSYHTMGRPAFIKYLITTTLLYCFLIFMIEAFTFYNFGLMLLRVICSTLLSALLMIAIESLMDHSNTYREKRL